MAPENLAQEFRKIHLYLTFCTSTPMQYALADFKKNRSIIYAVFRFYEDKRHKFLNFIKGSRFRFTPSKGSYFQNLSYAQISEVNDTELVILMTREMGVASIPVSVFYHKKNDYKLLRFCFAKDDEMLERAGNILAKF
jgi:methionine transaminase